MRRFLLGLAVAAALAVPAVATAQVKPPQPDVVCGTACDGGGSGWTGCTTVTGNDQGGVPRDRVLASLPDRLLLQGSWVDHAAVDHRPRLRRERVRILQPRSGLDRSGGVGSGWAYLEGHAYYGTTVNRLTGLSYTSVANVWIWMG